jgi:surface antigen
LYLLILIANSNLVYAQNWQSPAFDNWANPTTSAGIIYNAAKWFSSRLDKEDMLTHRSAVFQALNNLENGETVVWRNDWKNTEGIVQIAYTWPNRGAICRRVYSWVKVKNNSRSYEDTACLDSNHRTWTFVDKY